MGTRARLCVAGLVLCGVIAGLGPGVSARAGEIGTTPAEKCNPTGRKICLTVKTFENITASDPTRATDGKRFTWVEWTLRNGGGSTLTNPAVTVSFADLCGAGLSACTGSSTAQFVLPAEPNICSASGSNLVCLYPNLGAGVSAATTRVYFKTADKTATRDVRASDITAMATAKERANDGNPCGAGDPNCDTFSVTLRNSYEPEPDAAYTFALNGKSFQLPTDDGLSSFSFTSATAVKFLTQFKVLPPSSTFCFSTVVCFDRTLSVDTQSATGFSTTNPVLFYARLLDPPSGVTVKNLSAIHFYDPVALTSDGTTVTAAGGPSFARIDGLRMETASFGLTAGTKYFVVQPSGTSFKVSLTKGGAPVPLSAGTGGRGSPIRIIGDQDDERSTACSASTPPAASAVPSICAQKFGPKALDSFVWDLGNGFLVH